jgi:hypothetical protein
MVALAPVVLVDLVKRLYRWLCRHGLHSWRDEPVLTPIDANCRFVVTEIVIHRCRHCGISWSQIKV